MKDFLYIIKSNFLFSGIEQKELQKLLPALKPRIKNFKRGAWIINRGDAVKNFGIVLSGSISIVKEDIGGNRSIIANCLAGDIFAEALAAAHVQASPVSVSAAQDCAVLFIPFDEIINTSPLGTANLKIIKNMMQLLANKNVFLNSKLEHISKRTIREKLLSYFAELKAKTAANTFILPMSKTDLADFLFIDRSALGRELTQMRREGLLDFKGRQIKLNNLKQKSRVL